MTGLQISEHLTLPVDFVTKTAAVLAQRRKGKRLDVDTPLPTPTGWTTMGGAAAMMDALIAAYPAALSNEQLAQASGNALTGGTFSNYRGVLVRNGLAESGEDGGLRASRVLVGDL